MAGWRDVPRRTALAITERILLPKLPPILAILGVTLALTACSSSSTPEEATNVADAASSSAECTTSGESSDAVSVSGDFATEPTVTFDTPLKTTETERTVVIEGSGEDVATTGSTVEVSYSAYHATSGDQIDTTGFGADAPRAALVVDDTRYITGLVKAVNCAVSGDRIVVIISPADAFGDNGSTDFGIGPDDSMIFVIDVNEVLPTRATGEDQAAEDGFPTVKLADDGTPTITIPDAEAPSELKVSTLKKGDGSVVAEGDTVTLEYTGVNWATGETFDSSWTTVGPASFATTDLVEGFGTALVGQTVGSQVLAIIPPALGYGTAGNDAAGISGTDTLVFVVDILDTAPTVAG